MKKRLAMIVTMLMVTVSMAACGGKKKIPLIRNLL